MFWKRVKGRQRSFRRGQKRTKGNKRSLRAKINVTERKRSRCIVVVVSIIIITSSHYKNMENRKWKIIIPPLKYETAKVRTLFFSSTWKIKKKDLQRIRLSFFSYQATKQERADTHHELLFFFFTIAKENKKMPTTRSAFTSTNKARKTRQNCIFFFDQHKKKGKAKHLFFLPHQHTHTHTNTEPKQTPGAVMWPSRVCIFDADTKRSKDDERKRGTRGKRHPGRLSGGMGADGMGTTGRREK